MKIVLTGSLGHIGKPLAKMLVGKGHMVLVISSTSSRREEIEALGAKSLIGKMEDKEFLIQAFKGADVVYTMMAVNAYTGAYSDQSLDVDAKHLEIATNYAFAIQESGVNKVIHLSTIGAHRGTGVGLLNPHSDVENILSQLSSNVHIKFIRPVGFYYNMLAFIPTIKSSGAIFQNYGGNEKEPWVSPLDIAEAIAEEMDKPFDGTTIRYVASDEVSPNQIAKVLGESIGEPELSWVSISDEQFLKGLIDVGINPQIAKGLTEMNVSRVNGLLYEDYFRNKPELGKVKLMDFAKEFAKVYAQK
ncbi:NmrA family NAD(P)-binding protein [uncultured Algoriphagus sp.]|uniref:NmrA family NAD(P)-binding protein n=1 Tax=uncultured Algoriphagus sp. TaxID=417365 RepID=UPI0030EB7CA1|tara:strand:+ start:66209 stop:67117 length:909 start_codon:yes stop_codon:yes gene_type:complete